MGIELGTRTKREKWEDILALLLVLILVLIMAVRMIQTSGPVPDDPPPPTAPAAEG